MSSSSNHADTSEFQTFNDVISVGVWTGAFPDLWEVGQDLRCPLVYPHQWPLPQLTS
jgi:hypothetical protein